MNWIHFKSQDSYLVSRVSLRVLKIVLRLLTAILSYFFFEIRWEPLATLGVFNYFGQCEAYFEFCWKTKIPSTLFLEFSRQNERENERKREKKTSGVLQDPSRIFRNCYTFRTRLMVLHEGRLRILGNFSLLDSFMIHVWTWDKLPPGGSHILHVNNNNYYLSNNRFGRIVFQPQLSNDVCSAFHHRLSTWCTRQKGIQLITSIPMYCSYKLWSPTPTL